MAFDKPDDTITLFKNDRSKGAKDPMYKGNGKVNGREYWASAWVNRPRDGGDPYMKIKVQAKQDEKRKSYDRQRSEESREAAFDDEIPF